MPSSMASRRAAALSPIARIAAAGGPTQRMPAASTASAKSAFSARKPNPGWSASAPAARRGTDDRRDVEEVDGARARDCRRRDPDAQRVALSVESVARSRPGWRRRGGGSAPGGSVGRAASPRGARTNASNASDATRHLSPTRRAGRRPRAIQRWTERVVAPIRRAAWLGLSSSDVTVSRLSRRCPTAIRKRQRMTDDGFQTRSKVPSIQSGSSARCARICRYQASCAGSSALAR